jgi:hypothetical protein
MEPTLATNAAISPEVNRRLALTLTVFAALAAPAAA